LSLGAVGFITKTVWPALLLVSVRAHLELKAARDWLADKNVYRDAEVQMRSFFCLLEQENLDAIKFYIQIQVCVASLFPKESKHLAIAVDNFSFKKALNISRSEMKVGAVDIL
jgi:hypothetical protein